MKLNYETVIVGDRCILAPYRPEHVEKYHEWMQDPALLEATASEPLSLEEECEMQESWRQDDAKCTFIVLARDLLLDTEELEQLVSESEGDPAAFVSADFIQRSLVAMVGDVNLFLSEEEDDDDDDDDDDGSGSNSKNAAVAASNSSDATNKTEAGIASTEPIKHWQAELDIMIAEKEYRGKGVGREAASLMMLFGATNLSVRRYFCKINQDNAASLHLFQAKLGFRQCAYAACFREVEQELRADSSQQMVEKLLAMTVRSGGSSHRRRRRRLRTCSCPLSNNDGEAASDADAFQTTTDSGL